MRITFTQSGGFVGAMAGCRIDTAELAPDERREAESLVAASGLTDSFERFSPTGRDRRQYEITIEGESPTLTVVFDESSLPAAARPLVGFLASRARPQRPDA